MTVFNASLHDPGHPTSFARYSLVLDEPGSTYTMTIQMLADNPSERDWRSEFSTVSGTFAREGDSLAFSVETGRQGVRSSGWRGRVDEWVPFPSFSGVVQGDVLRVHFHDELVLQRSDAGPLAQPALIIPDYEFA